MQLINDININQDITFFLFLSDFNLSPTNYDKFHTKMYQPFIL